MLDLQHSCLVAACAGMKVWESPTSFLGVQWSLAKDTFLKVGRSLHSTTMPYSRAASWSHSARYSAKLRRTMRSKDGSGPAQRRVDVRPGDEGLGARPLAERARVQVQGAPLGQHLPRVFSRQGDECLPTGNVSNRPENTVERLVQRIFDSGLFVLRRYDQPLVGAQPQGPAFHPPSETVLGSIGSAKPSAHLTPAMKAGVGRVSTQIQITQERPF